MAGALAKALNGARIVLNLDGKTVGIAQSVGVAVGYQVDPVYVIGKYETAELVPNSQQPITITMRMIRIVGTSPLSVLRQPTLDDVSSNGLLLNQDFSITLGDRQNSKNPVPGQSVPFLSIAKCRTTSFSFDSTASQTSEMTLTMTGIYIGDEGVSTTQNQDADTPAFDVL
jgi:hypothetical protein